MKKHTALIVILCIAIAGLLFSGYLTYGEVFAKICYATELGMWACNNVAWLPACVYGFGMYVAITVFSVVGLVSKK